jgi:hypothetical protein
MKKLTNDWLVCVTRPTGAEGIAFGPSDSVVNDPEAKVEDICGQECAHKRFSIWLTNHSAPLTAKGGEA